MKKTGKNIDFKPKQGITFDKSKIECFNCQKTGHFARECRFAKYQANRMTEKPKLELKEIPITDTKALVAQESLSEVDWSAEFDDEPVTYCRVAMEEEVNNSVEELDWSSAFNKEAEHAALDPRDCLGGFDWSLESEDDPVLLAMVATSPSSSPISEVCSNCHDFYQKLLSNYVYERDNCVKARSEVAGYQITLESMEAKILTHENNEMAWAEKYEQQDYQLKLSEWKLNCKIAEIEKLTKERDELLAKFDAWNESGLSHVSYVDKQKRAYI